MSLSIGGKIGQIFLVGLNISFALLGIGVMVVGIVIKTNKDLFDSDITRLLKEIEIGGMALHDLVDVAAIVIICVGCFTVALAALGGIGAFCKVRCMLISYIIIMIIIILLEIAVLVLWCLLINGVNLFLKEQFENLLKEYSGPLGQDVSSVGWNLVFLLFGCCGVSPVTATYNDFKELPTKYWTIPSRGSNRIPESCCADTNRDSYRNYTNPACTRQLNGYYTSGCYDVFDELFTKLATSAITISVILILVEIAAVVFSCLITYEVTRKKTSGAV